MKPRQPLRGPEIPCLGNKTHPGTLELPGVSRPVPEGNVFSGWRYCSEDRERLAVQGLKEKNVFTHG